MESQIEGTNIGSHFIFMSLAKTVIQQDIKHIQNGSFKIKEPYIDQLERMHTKATKTCYDLKKEMRDKRITVILIDKRNHHTEYKVTVGGREKTMTYNNHIIRRNVKEILEDLIQY